MFAYLMEMIWYEVLGVWNLSLCFTSELKALHRTALVANCQIPCARVVLVVGAWATNHVCLLLFGWKHSGCLRGRRRDRDRAHCSFWISGLDFQMTCSITTILSCTSMCVAPHPPHHSNKMDTNASQHCLQAQPLLCSRTPYDLLQPRRIN
jgi:hypothetical protein